MAYVFNWSGGKDSAMALHIILQQGIVPEYLLSTVSEEGRVSMHGVENGLLLAQTKALNIPLKQIVIPHNCSMDRYSSIMKSAWEELIEKGIKNAIFGDIFLEDLKQYRDEQSAKMGICNHYPLWKKDSLKLSQYFINEGFKSIVICVDASVLDQSFVGREYNEAFINDLPPSVDACGENGEFHTFCYQGPIYGAPIKFKTLEIIKKHYPQKDATEGETKNEVKNWNSGFWYQNITLEQ